MAISEALKRDIEAYATHLRGSNELFKQARCGEVTPSAIATYIANLRLLVQHTDTNLRLAEKRAEELGKTSLARFFAEKRREEVGHDRWADNDMATLSGMFGVTHAAEPSRSITGLLYYLRAMIAEEPMHYLAYILFSEYVTVLLGPEWLRLLEDRCGIPTSAMTVVGNHVELDKSHVDEGLREIDRLVGDGDPLEPMRVALRTFMRYFEGFCSEISAISTEELPDVA
jgi:hypothetical protein